MTTPIKISDVASVYSGKAGACCCGCKGNHRYASKHREFAAKYRGYPISDDEVNDRQVAKVVGILNASDDAALLDNDDNMVAVEIGNRMYVAYLVPAADAVAAA
jgi:hypothetical protein